MGIHFYNAYTYVHKLLYNITFCSPVRDIMGCGDVPTVLYLTTILLDKCVLIVTLHTNTRHTPHGTQVSPLLHRLEGFEDSMFVERSCRVWMIQIGSCLVEMQTSLGAWSVFHSATWCFVPYSLLHLFTVISKYITKSTPRFLRHSNCWTEISFYLQKFNI